MNISFCIPLKNNLRYFKKCLSSIRENSFYKNHEVIVFLDSDNDGTEKFLLEQKIKYIKNSSNIPKGISYGYNRCAEIASSDILMMFHADMILGKHADLNVLKYIKRHTVVSSTRIEPPLHPAGKEKIIKDFGFWPEEDVKDGFKSSEFNNFIESKLIENKNITTRGIFAPWIIYKQDFFDIGMHDELFHSYQEDSDIFNRFILGGFEIIQSWDSLVYHLTCRGGQFQDGLSVTSDVKFHRMKQNCANNYIRKWGRWIQNDEYNYPIIGKKYDIGMVIKNCNEELLAGIEPWATTVHVDIPTNSYINRTQKDTKINLSKKIKNIEDDKINDIIIEFDGLNFKSNLHSNIICNLQDIISTSGEIGKMEYDIFTFDIKNLNTFEKNLITLNDSYYKSLTIY